MAKIQYFNGKTLIEIEVSAKVSKAFADFSLEEQRTVWRNKKRKPEKSIDEMQNLGLEISSDENIEGQIIELEERQEIREAIRRLSPSQQELVYKLFYNELSEREIAEQEGVSQSAIAHRKKRIFAQLNKYLKNL